MNKILYNNALGSFTQETLCLRKQNIFFKTDTIENFTWVERQRYGQSLLALSIFFTLFYLVYYFFPYVFGFYLVTIVGIIFLATRANKKQKIVLSITLKTNQNFLIPIHKRYYIEAKRIVKHFNESINNK